MLPLRSALNLSFLSRTALIVTGVICAGWCAHVVTQRLVEFDSSAAVIFIWVPALLTVGCAYAAARLSARTVRLIVKEMLFLGAVLLSVETMIAISAPDIPSAQLTRKRVAAKLGLSFDARTKSEVVAALQSQGIDALPGVSPRWPQLSGLRQQLPENFFPLSNASNASIVECNETGEYLSYQTDDFGFNNPKGLLTSRQIDIAAIGGSFTFGDCVEPQQGLIGSLRQRFPRIANFGLPGSDVLSMLATFREYVQPLEPPVVLWLIDPSSVDAHTALADPILSRYLEPQFTQHLLERQDAVDRTWRELAISEQFELDRRTDVDLRRASADQFSKILTLYNVRHRLQLDQLPIVTPKPTDLSPLLTTLRLAKQTTEQWGGTFVVIIVPGYPEVVADKIEEPLRHTHLRAVVEQLGIPVIDTVEKVLDLPDPRALYALRIGNHPTPAGYDLLGDFVTAELQQRFPDMFARFADHHDP